MTIREETVFERVSAKKGEIFDKMIEVIENAGWENISSRPASDFYVFHSKGEDNAQDLYFQISPSYETANISTGYVRYFGARLLTSYVPGATGIAGISTPANQTWGGVGISGTDRYPKHPFDLYYVANKDRIMFIFEDTYTKSSYFFYVGKPRPTYNKTYNNQGMVMFSYSIHASLAVQTIGEADTRRTTSHAINAVTSGTNAIALDASGNLMLHDVVFTSNTGGFMGYVDGIYAINNDARLGGANIAGDIIDINYKKYRIFHLDDPTTSYRWSYWTETSRHLAVRID